MNITKNGEPNIIGVLGIKGRKDNEEINKMI